MVVNGEVRYTGAGCRWVTLDPVKCCVCGGELGAYVDDTYRAFCGHTCMEEAGSELGDDEVRRRQKCRPRQPSASDGVGDKVLLSARARGDLVPRGPR